MTGSAFTILHNPHNHLHPKCSHPAKADRVPISCHLCIPSPQPVVTIDSLSVSMDFPVLDVSYKWNHGQCGLWCLLPSLSVVSSRSIHVVADVRAPFPYVAEFYSPHMDGPHSAHPSNHWWRLGSFPCFGCCE